jgi:serine/threonine protein kinase
MLNTTIKDYHIQRELGRGGMAVVYLAHDIKFDTNVAVKVLNKEYVHNENIRKRFLAEARNMFRMSHPNIIKVTDLIDNGDTVAFVMEYLEGETLKDYLDRKGRLGDEEIKLLITQMLDAVGYVHKQNLVHRDIKPSNFIFGSEGRIKLLDFGIAKNSDASSAEYTQTGAGIHMGTPMYMSPEQVTETKNVMAQSDIYSLGVVLWQMVMGKKPYDAETLSNFQLQNKIVNEQLLPTDTIWDQIILKTAAKKINERFYSCEEALIIVSKWFINNSIGNIKHNSPENKNEHTIIEKNISSSELLIGSILNINNNQLIYGLINRQGNWVIQPMFDIIGDSDVQGYYCIKLNEKWGFINKQGNWVIYPMFDRVFSFDEWGFCNVVLNKKWGIINRQGNWVFQPLFDFISKPNKQGICHVEINNKYGFVNQQQGNWVIQPIFECDVDDNFYKNIFDDQGFCLVRLNEKDGFIDLQGNWVIQPIFDQLHLFDDQGRCEARLGEKWGFINRNGNWFIEPIFDYVSKFNEQGFSIAALNEKWGIINHQGDWVIQPEFDNILFCYYYQGFCRVEINKKWGIINLKGEWIIQPMFDIVSDFDYKDYFLVELNHKRGLINQLGNWIIQPNYDDLYNFNDEGYFIAEIDKKWGIINLQGNWILQPMFDYVHEFDDQGYCRVNLNDKEGFIDRLGNWIIQPIFDNVGKFDDQGFCEVELNDKVGVINRSGNWIFQPFFDSIRTFDELDGVFEVEINKKKGWINRNGEWNLPARYFLLEKIDNNTFKASENNKYGYIDRQGNWIIQPQFDYFLDDFWDGEMSWNEIEQTWE